MQKEKIGKVRTIYNNYDIFEKYETVAREEFAEDGNTDPSDADIAERVYQLDEDEWEEAKLDLENFFGDGSTWLLTGTVELWTGKYEGGFLFKTWQEMITKAGKDCEYFHYYDVNGHFYLCCSHHDGTNLFEIRKVTEKGMDYYERWESAPYTDKRSERDIHKALIERYTVLPNYAHEVWGCKRREFVENTEGQA